MKTLKVLLVVAGLLLAAQLNSNAQNWGFSLPFGNGGFAINGKNWTAGLNGAVAGGGRGGWGFQLPNGSGFYNGAGGGPVPVGGGCGGGPYYGNPGVAQAYWSGVGGSYDRNGWNYGPAYYQRIPESASPVRWLPVPGNFARRGGAAYQSVTGQVWVRQPY